MPATTVSEALQNAQNPPLNLNPIPAAAPAGAANIAGPSQAGPSNPIGPQPVAKAKKPHVCDVPGCDASFTFPTALKNHKKKCHAHQEPADSLHCLTCKKNGNVQIKQRPAGSVSGNCPQCSIFWCLVGDCWSESTSRQYMNKHQRSLHNANFMNTCSQCKGPKIRTPGCQEDVCPNANCKAWFCLLDGCSHDNKDEIGFRLHQSRIHKVTVLSEHGDSINCRCGVAKGGIGRFAQCPNCNKYWCLMKPCVMTFASLPAMKQHIDRGHK